MTATSSAGAPKLSLALLEGTYAIARLAPSDAIPEWAVSGPFHSITRTGAELSIICAAAGVPAEVRAERDWKCLEVAGPLDFSEVGIMATLSGVLAAADVSVMAVATYDTDYLLVRVGVLERAVAALDSAGHSVAK